MSMAVVDFNRKLAPNLAERIDFAPQIGENPETKHRSAVTGPSEPVGDDGECAKALEGINALVEEETGRNLALGKRRFAIEALSGGDTEKRLYRAGSASNRDRLIHGEGEKAKVLKRIQASLDSLPKETLEAIISDKAFDTRLQSFFEQWRVKKETDAGERQTQERDPVSRNRPVLEGRLDPTGRDGGKKGRPYSPVISAGISAIGLLGGRDDVRISFSSKQDRVKAIIALRKTGYAIGYYADGIIGVTSTEALKALNEAKLPYDRVY